MLCSPALFLDVESFIEADNLVTPDSIKPEWYFLVYYAMLRSVESKVGGLIFVVCFLLVLWVPTSKVSSCYSFVRQILFWSLCSMFIVLSYLGGCHAEYPFVLLSKILGFALLFLLSLYKGFWRLSNIGGVIHWGGLG